MAVKMLKKHHLIFAKEKDADEVLSKISYQVDKWVDDIENELETKNGEYSFELDPKDLGGI